MKTFRHGFNRWLGNALLVCGISISSFLGPMVASDVNSIPGIAYAATGELEIPTQLVDPPPHCDLCWIKPARVSDPSGQGPAKVELYFEVVGGDVQAKLEVDVELLSGWHQRMTLFDVLLLDQQINVLTLAPGPGWTWRDARTVSIEVVALE